MDSNESIVALIIASHVSNFEKNCVSNIIPSTFRYGDNYRVMLVYPGVFFDIIVSNLFDAIK
jgi:hypothetical protein